MQFAAVVRQRAQSLRWPSKYQSEMALMWYIYIYIFFLYAQYIVDDAWLARLLAANCKWRHHNFLRSYLHNTFGDIFSNFMTGTFLAST